MRTHMRNIGAQDTAATYYVKPYFCCGHQHAAEAKSKSLAQNSTPARTRPPLRTPCVPAPAELMYAEPNGAFVTSRGGLPRDSQLFHRRVNTQRAPKLRHSRSSMS